VITTNWVMAQGPRELQIFGPPGIARFVEHTMTALEPDIGYRIAHHDDLDYRPNVTVTEVEPGDAFELGAASISVFETVHAPVHPTVGFRIEHGDKVAALAGDTIPCDGLDALVTDADAYVQTVIRDDLVKLIPSERLQDILDYHSSVEQAAQTAARNGAKRLVLTHMVPAPQPEQYDEWVAIAAAHFDGEIVIGDDLTTVTI
jgi:ribonuclease Z